MRVEKVFAGITLIFMGLALLTISSAMNVANVEYGGVVIIGPLPIIFGSSLDMAVFGIVFAVILILLMLAFLR
jgi:uncharacterized protein (TIGR00304 family)